MLRALRPQQAAREILTKHQWIWSGHAPGQQKAATANDLRHVMARFRAAEIASIASPDLRRQIKGLEAFAMVGPVVRG
jgi:hypothetical protein